MKELALIQAYRFIPGEYADSVPYFICDSQGNLVSDDDLSNYVDTKNNVLKEFYGFDIVAPKLTSKLYMELVEFGMQSTFESDVKTWLSISKPKLRRLGPEEAQIVEWYAVYEFSSGYNSTFDGDEYWYEFELLGQLDEINLEYLVTDPIDKNNN